MKYITKETFNPKNRFCRILDAVSRTVQDATVDIPTLLKQFNGRLDDLFYKYNNGLVFESQIGVFVDELNASELAAFNNHQAEIARLESEKKHTEQLFEAWKSEVSQRVAQVRAESVPKPTVSEPSASSE